MTQHLIYNEAIKSKDLYSVYQYVEGKYYVYAKESIKEYVKLSKRKRLKNVKVTYIL